LEWLPHMPPENWGVRSIPEIDSRYPLWDQPHLQRDVDEGRFYLPDAEEGRRETIVTSVVDAKPVQCLRLPGPSFIPLVAALTTGGFFIFGTYHLWWLALISAVVATGVIWYWLWVGTSVIAEKSEKCVGLGLHLPLYMSGSRSVSWWAMFIMMLADLTAFISLVFGYFFYWTIQENFPPKPAPGPGVLWPALAAALLLSAWGLTVLSKGWNRHGPTARFYGALALALVCGLGGAAAILGGPWFTELDPKANSYSATVWLLAIWTAFHAVIGVIMQLYCLARRAAGKLTADHDIDLCNVTLYWHFMALTAALTVAVIAGFPLLL
jgi:cytochrome c oxidase subunit I+III